MNLKIAAAAVANAQCISCSLTTWANINVSSLYEYFFRILCSWSPVGETVLGPTNKYSKTPTAPNKSAPTTDAHKHLEDIFDAGFNAIVSNENFAFPDLDLEFYFESIQMTQSLVSAVSQSITE